MADSFMEFTPLMLLSGNDYLVRVDDGSANFWQGVTSGKLRLRFVFAGYAAYGSGEFVIVQLRDLEQLQEEGTGYTLQRVDEEFDFDTDRDLYVSPGNYHLLAVNTNTRELAYLTTEQQDGAYLFSEDRDRAGVLNIVTVDGTGNINLGTQLNMSFGGVNFPGKFYKWKQPQKLEDVRISNCVQQPGSCPSGTRCYDGEDPSIFLQVGVCYNSQGNDLPVCEGSVAGVCPEGFTCVQTQDGAYECQENLPDDNDLSSDSFVNSIWFWTLIVIVAALLLLVAFSAVIKSE